MTRITIKNFDHLHRLNILIYSVYWYGDLFSSNQSFKSRYRIILKLQETIFCFWNLWKTNKVICIYQDPVISAESVKIKTAAGKGSTVADFFLNRWHLKIKIFIKCSRILSTLSSWDSAILQYKKSGKQ